MDASVFALIALIGLLIFGGEIKFNGLLQRPKSPELRDGERKLLDE
jgi:hypothetical protein